MSDFVSSSGDSTSLASAVSAMLGLPATDIARKEAAAVNRDAAASTVEDAARTAAFADASAASRGAASATADAAAEAEKKKRVLSPEFRAHTFRKGQSGNPRGRRRMDPEIKTQLVAGSVEAVRALRDIVADADASPKDRMAAAEIILERVYGKAAQPIDAALGGGNEPVRFEFIGVLDDWAK